MVNFYSYYDIMLGGKEIACYCGGLYGSVANTLFYNTDLILKPYAPDANAHAERVIRSVREECLDRIIILNEKHLRFVLKRYEKYYNEARPHQGISQRIPNGAAPSDLKGPIRRRQYLGGLLNDYYREAA